MAGGDDFVTIRRLADPVEAELLSEVLEEEGIPASVPGNVQSTMLGGMSASATLVPLRVPSEHAERATELLEALDEYDEVDPEDAPAAGPAPSSSGTGDGPYRSSAREEETVERPRKKGVAVAAALLLPAMCTACGAGHFYVRSYQRGFILLGLGWLCALLAINGERWVGIGIPVVIFLDAMGATKLIDAQREAG